MTKKFSKKGLIVTLAILIVAALFIILRNHDKNNDEVYVEVKTIHTELGWGYNILTDGKVYIHQEFIPAITGKYGFKTEEDALKVGRKVISKISQKELPSISVSDLKELGIVNDPVAGR